MAEASAAATVAAAACEEDCVSGSQMGCFAWSSRLIMGEGKGLEKMIKVLALS